MRFAKASGYRSLIWAGMGLLIAGFAGCGGAAAKTVAVTGKVTFSDGSPVAKGGVAFNGTAGKAFSATGETKEDGTYQLSTFEENDGVPAGEYTVVVTANGQQATVIEPKTVKVEAGKTTIDIKVEK